MRYERKYIQYNDLVFDGYGMLGEYDASSVSFKVTTHARSFGHGSYAPFKSKNAFVEESSVSLTLWLKEKKLPCDVRPFYRSFVIEQLSKHGKLWAVQDNTLVWAYATVQSYSEMVEHANGKLGIDVDFLLYEGVWHKADKQKTFLHPYDLCSYMECFDYREYHPCKDAYLMTCGDCGEINIDPQTKSGSIVEIEKVNPHDAVASMGLEIEPQQDLNGYDNPWAAGAGKNKLNKATFEQGTINTWTGAENSSATRIRSTWIYVSAGTYTISSPSFRCVVCVYSSMSADDYIQSESTTSWQGSPYTFTLSNDRYIRIVFSRSSGNITPSELTTEQLESGATATTFAPYENICPITGFDSANIYVSPTTSVGDATTYNVSFGSAGTVYGGTLDVVSGQLTVTHKLVDGTTSNITRNNATQYYTKPNDIKVTGSSYGKAEGLLSNQFFPYESGMSSSTVGMVFVNSGGAIRFNTANSYNSVSDLVSDLGTIQFVYPLETPLTYQLTPTQVAMIMGNNYVWADTGDITVSTTGYHRDASDGCLTPTPDAHNDRYCCECDCDSLSPDMALCYHLDDLQDVYKECSNAGFRVIYDCEAAERFFNILGQQICSDSCGNGTIAGKIYSETDIPTTGVSITLVGKMHNPYVEINGNGNWIAGDYNGRLRIEPNGEVYFENGCRCDDPLEPDVWQVPPGMNYGWTVLPRYNRVVVNLGACCGKACAYFNIDNLTI